MENISRRNTLKLLGTLALYLPFSKFTFGSTYLPSKPPVLPRIPLDEFVKDQQLLDALRKGVKAMKSRKPSDPLSWFYQAAIHGVSDDALAEAKKTDPNITDDLVNKMWNQCPHNGQNSANFLPWHRAYTYHFEKILRLHTGMADFSLPYWNYIDVSDEDKRTFPKEYGIKHLDGNMNNDAEDNINSLYLEERDFYFANYEHPFSDGLPLTILSKGAVDISKVMNCPVFFGQTETEGIAGGLTDSDTTTRGLVEKYPHDQIHRAVGGIVKTPNTPPDSESVGAMAYPPTAAFDPIFPIHHTTIDWIWVQWATMPGKSWGQLPNSDWFNEQPWYFIETDGSVVNKPRKSYFDHKALGISFKYENLTTEPLQLPSIPSALFQKQFTFKKQSKTTISKINQEIKVYRNEPAITKIADSALQKLSSQIKSGLQTSRILLTLNDVQLGKIDGTGFELYLISGAATTLSNIDDSFIGSIVLFAHHHDKTSTAMTDHGGMNMEMKNPQTFDVTKALNAATGLENLRLIIKPFSLYEGKRKPVIEQPLIIKGLEFSTTKP